MAKGVLKQPEDDGTYGQVVFTGEIVKAVMLVPLWMANWWGEEPSA